MIEDIIIDLDGTVYRESEPIDGVKQAIETLRSKGIRITFLTNNATASRKQYVEKLEQFGITTSPESILTSGRIAASYLSDVHQHKTIFVIGEEPLRTELRGYDLNLNNSPNHPDILLTGLTREFNYESLKKVLRAFTNNKDLRFIATNTDQTRPGPEYPLPSTGGIIGAINGVTGRKPDTVTGKPSSIAGNVLQKERDITPETAMVVGDRYETDIQFGKNLGMETVLVLSGATKSEDTVPSSDNTTKIIRSIASIEQILPD